jgi:hypothetical protein
MNEIRITLTEVEPSNILKSKINSTIDVYRSVDDTEFENKIALEVLKPIAVILNLSEEQNQYIEKIFCSALSRRSEK